MAAYDGLGSNGVFSGKRVLFPYFHGLVQGEGYLESQPFGAIKGVVLDKL